MKFHKVAFILLIIGGLNWGLEAFDTGLGHWGLPSGVVRLVYILVGISAVSEILAHKKLCRMCANDMANKPMNQGM